MLLLFLYTMSVEGPIHLHHVSDQGVQGQDHGKIVEKAPTFLITAEPETVRLATPGFFTAPRRKGESPMPVHFFSHSPVRDTPVSEEAGAHNLVAIGKLAIES